MQTRENYDPTFHDRLSVRHRSGPQNLGFGNSAGPAVRRIGGHLPHVTFKPRTRKKIQAEYEMTW